MRNRAFQEVNLYSIKSIPSEWSLTKLKNISEVQISNVDKKTAENERTVYLCNYTDVYYNDKIDSTMKFMKATASGNQIDKFKLKKNDVIITKDSETADDIGVATWVSEDFDDVVCGYHLSLIRPNKDEIDGRYLFYSLSSPGFRDHFWNYANGVTRYGISKGAIKNTPVLLPGLDTQMKIADFLNQKTAEIDSLIADKEQLIQLLEEKRQAVITEAVTKGLDSNVKMKDSDVEWIGEIPDHWCVKKLKYLFEIKKRIENIENPEILSVTQKGIKVKDISTNEGQLAANYDKYQTVKVGDFVMNHMDLLTGFIDISKFNGVTSPDYRVFEIRNEKFIEQYFLYYFQMSYYRRIFYKFGQGVSSFGRWRLPADEFYNFYVPVPTIKEQEEIVKYISNHLYDSENVIEQTRNTITKLKEYRQSLIYEAVTGKIDVQEMASKWEQEVPSP